MLLLSLIVVFRIRLSRKGSSRLKILVFRYLYLCIIIFAQLIRFYLYEQLSLSLLSGFIFCVAGKEVITYSGPSGASSSSSWKEDSFEIGVLLEPFSFLILRWRERNTPIPRVAGEEAGPSHQTTLCHNFSMESSLRNRIGRLEHEGCIFLNQKWSEKKELWIKLPLKGSMISYSTSRIGISRSGS